MIAELKHSSAPLVEVRNLVKHFPITGGVFLREVASVKAVDGVDLAISEGRRWGLWESPGAASPP